MDIVISSEILVSEVPNIEQKLVFQRSALKSFLCGSFIKRQWLLADPIQEEQKPKKEELQSEKKEIEKRFKKMGIVASLAAIPIGEDIIR